MRTERYEKLNAQLGLEFDLFAIEHTGWMHKHVPNGAEVVLQTDDPGFNKWARDLVLKSRHLDDVPDRPIVLVHVKKLRPQRSRIVELDAELYGASGRARRKTPSKQPERREKSLK